MLHKDWLNSGKCPTIGAPRRIFEDREVFCLDCDCNQTLLTNSSGQLVCSVCTGAVWMYVTAPLVAHFQNYNEGLARAAAAGNSFARSCPVL